ncbi:hypothetical protein OAP69_02035 [Hellea sp.]|nr:hypothetical protein [Hellea sp.]
MNEVYIPNNMNIARRMTGIIMLIIGVALIIALYYVKIRSQTANQEVRRLERLVVEEKNAIRVLQAEIAFLENPDRLRNLSNIYLSLQPISAKNIISIDEIVNEFPLREAKVD